ncbi:MAG: hypothetical protein IID44_08825 [Planctomycetes bacterium]|nr:hypothetical protein [Planctomycetota bacterium]
MGYLDFPQALPRLNSNNSEKKSDPDTGYNCIAFAAGDRFNWWWPIGRYWPPGVPREETLDAFVQAFNTLGYETCSGGTLTEDTEKIAIYATPSGKPTHAARQLECGKWTSKIGEDDDIHHTTPQDVEGPGYGEAAIFMGRPRDIS